MSFNIAEIQVREEKNLLRQMQEGCQIDTYLATVRDRMLMNERSNRDYFLHKGILLTPKISPRVFKVVEMVYERLGITLPYDIFVVTSEDLNALVLEDIAKNEAKHLIVFCSRILEEFDDEKLCFVLGHEFGHLLFKHNQMLALKNSNLQDSKYTILPFRYELLYRKWEKVSELTADRIGMLACRNEEAVYSCLLKILTGMTGKNIETNIELFVRQLEELSESPEANAVIYGTHPLLPIRLKSASMFLSSEMRKKVSGEGEGTISTEEMETKIEEIFHLIRRYPRSKEGLSAMKLLTAGGVKIIKADKKAEDEEYELIYKILLEYFTDEPEKELKIDFSQLDLLINENAEKLKKSGNRDLSLMVIQMLTHLAIADNEYVESEASVLTDIAKRLGFEEKEILEILITMHRIVGIKSNGPKLDNLLK